MNRYWSPVVHDLTPYVPGEQPVMSRLVKLNTNEHPCGPSPKVFEAIRNALDDDLRRYPDPDAGTLRRALADLHGVGPEQIFVGNGSDEVLAHAFHALFQHPGVPLLFPDVTYSFYPSYCRLYRIAARAVPLADDFSLRVADYLQPNAGIIFPNPNAPTGMLVSLDDIAWLLERNRDSVVLVDEAYIDFGGETAIALVQRYPNLLVTQTFSKSRALAGLRVGFAVGDRGLIEALQRVKDSFNSYPLDRLAMVGAVAALADHEHFARSRQAVIDARAALAEGLQQRGFIVLPSAANFLFARHPAHDAAVLNADLRRQGVVVRHFPQPRIDAFLRITVGTPADNEALLAALDHALASQCT